MSRLAFDLVGEYHADGTPVFVFIDPAFVAAVEERTFADIGFSKGSHYAVILMASGVKYTVYAPKDDVAERIWAAKSAR